MQDCLSVVKYISEIPISYDHTIFHQLVIRLYPYLRHRQTDLAPQCDPIEFFKGWVSDKKLEYYTYYRVVSGKGERGCLFSLYFPIYYSVGLPPVDR